MSLRARLVAAFFVILLAPMLLIAGVGYLAFGGVAGKGAQREAVRTVVTAACHRLTAEAESLAVLASARGEAYSVTDATVAQPWAICGVDPESVLLPAGTRYVALAARAEVRDDKGATIGYAYAVQRVDTLLDQLAAAAGCRVQLLGTGAVSTDAEQPLPLACPTAAASTYVGGLTWVIIPIGLVVLLATLLLSWWLSTLATRPLGQLLGAVDRVLAGDLTTRTAIGGRDEAARLGASLEELIGGIREARQLSVTDHLTGLGNLRRLREALHHEAERAGRFGRTLGVLVLDLDHFKQVNDQHGHRAGDAVLVEFAQRVRGVLREVDLTFRQGGEEFVVLLPETDLAGGITAAQRIGNAVRQTPFAIVRRDGEPALITVTVSVGIAVYPRHGLTGEGILEAGDAALYAAKAAGRDTYALAAPPLPGQREGAVAGRPTDVDVVASGGAAGGAAGGPSGGAAGGTAGGTTTPRRTPGR